MNQLISSPTVNVVGFTAMSADFLSQWAGDSDLTDVLEDSDTPLAKLSSAVENEELSPLDLMSEFGGRHCYRSWSKGRDTETYIKNILESGHGSVLEHASINLAIQGVSRSLTHELIRHRQGFAVSQESQRYVNAEDINFVIPPMLIDMVGGNMTDGLIADWSARQMAALENYKEDFAIYEAYLSEQGFTGRDLKKRTAEAARASLPNAAETRLVWTGNMRALRHFCETRGDAHADLEIRRLAVGITGMMKSIAPLTFGDMKIRHGDFGVGVVESEYRKV